MSILLLLLSLVRDYFPKGTDFKDITLSELEEVE